MSLKRTSLSLLVLLLLSVVCVAAAAETMSEVPLDKLAPPAPGKAVVYFFVPGDTPAIPSIPLYDTPDQLPNVLGAREYLRYECDPGLHTFFVGSGFESEWVHGDLEDGGIYAVLISYFLGDLVAAPMTGRLDSKLLLGMKTEAEQWPRVAKLLESKPPKPPGRDREGRVAAARPVSRTRRGQKSARVLRARAPAGAAGDAVRRR